jgi:hypothetical protein
MTLTAPSFRNRVKELRYVSPRELEDHPLQHKVHPDHQRSVMRGILEEIGIADVLLAYESPATGKLTALDGHLRKSLGDTLWPTVILDLDDAEAAYMLAVGDEVTLLAQKDQEALTRLLHEVQSGDSAVQQMLSELAERERLIPRAPGATQGVNDPAAEWQAMPAFQQEDQLARKALIVNFATPKPFLVLQPERSLAGGERNVGPNEGQFPLVAAPPYNPLHRLQINLQTLSRHFVSAH